MKTMIYFFMAALALMTAACSNEDNEITQQPQMVRGIPFTATLSMGNSAATRALSPGTGESEGNIVATWETGDKVALIYTVGETTYKKDATVTAQTNGTATVSTTLEGSPLDGSTVTIIYPSTAADKTTNDYIKTGLLVGQDGTLAGIAAKYDVRKGTGKLSISGSAGNETATVYDDNRTNNLVKLENQYSIFKFSVRDINGEAILEDGLSFTEFKVSDGDGNVKATFTGTITANDVYLAFPNLTAEKKYWFNASVSNGTVSKPYIAKATAAATAAGKYYPVTVKMATIGNFVLKSGKFAENGTSDDPAVAMIAYLGSATDNPTYKHGLALGLNDQNNGEGLTWESAKAICSSLNTFYPVGEASWVFPSETQWTKMDNQVREVFESHGLCSAFTGITGATNLKYAESTTEHILYWSSTEVKVGESYTSARAFDAYTPYWYDDPKTPSVTPYRRFCRAGLAF